MKPSLPIIVLTPLFAAVSAQSRAQSNDTLIGDQLARWSAEAGVPSEKAAVLAYLSSLK